MNESRVILALDAMNGEKAIGLAQVLKGKFGASKVNSAIIERGGSVVAALAVSGPVLADCRLHDIAFTNSNGIKALIEAGAKFITIHASMGVTKMRAAMKAAQVAAGDRKITVLAVTSLPDMTEEDCQSVYGGSIQEVELRLAKLAKEAGESLSTDIDFAEELNGDLAVSSSIIENGASILSDLAEFGPVFADCKFHNSIATNANGIKAVVKAGASFLTIHASMGVAKMKAAKEAAQVAAGDRNVTVLAITVLTDMTEEDCQSVYGGSVQEVVLRLAKLAKQAGVDGIVCSPQELRFLNEFDELQSLIKVTPNIRGSDTKVPDDDQNPNRKATPKEAVLWGADFTVIGRMITRPEGRTPVEAVVAINIEIAEAEPEATKVICD